ncbi:MAG: ATP-binding protein [Bacteroidia bacterium]
MKIKLQLFLFILTLILFCSLEVDAQKEFSVFQYTSKNGLPQNSVKSLILDDNGFLWMTTEGGLVRFDGRNFKTFDRANSPFIITDRLTDIFKNPSNEYFTFDGRGNAYKILSNKIIPINKDSMSLRDFYFKDELNGKNYFASHNDTSLQFFSGNNLIDSLNTKAYHVSGYFQFGNEIYFLGNKNDLYKVAFPQRRFIQCSLKNSFSFSTPIVLWDYGRPGIYLKDGFNLYILKPTGNKDEFETKLLCNKMPDKCVVTALFYDDINHILYVGTDSKGLFLYKEKFFRPLIYDKPEEGTNNAYYSQLALDSNNVLTIHKRQFSLDKVTKNNLPFSMNREGVIRDKNDNTWFNENKILYKYNLTSHQKIKIEGSEDTYAYCFIEEGDTMWIGNTHTIDYVINDSLHHVLNWDEKAPGSYPFNLLLAPDNKLWYSNCEGIYRLDKKNFTVDTMPEFKSQCVRNMTLHNNFIYIGTYGNGYYLMKDTKFVHMPMDRNNYLSQTHTFVFDQSGLVWMTTNRGLYKARMADLENYFNDTTIKVSYIYYGEEDGITNAEFNGGCSPSSLILKSGYVSLPTMEGLVWFKPNMVTDASPLSPVIIDAVYFDEKAIDTAQLANIPSSVQTLRFEFATPYWGNINNLYLEYKLEGFNHEWIPLRTQQSNITFSNLHSGKYSLLIRKKAGLNGHDNIITKVAINVEKKIFETIWFIVLCLLGATLFVIAVARIYAYNIKQRNKQLEEKVHERTSDLEKANKQMQQSVNVKDKLISILSHDILTPLRFISMVARKGGDASHDIEKESMRHAFHDIKNTSDKLRDNTQNILNWIKHQNKRISVNNTHLSIRALTDDVSGMLKEMADANSITVINNISHDDIIKTDRNILSIILHNVISNAIKFTEHGTISIESNHAGENYFIKITDTGEGMSEEQLHRIKNIIEHKTVSAPNPSSGESGNGLGFIIISELMELLKGNVMIDSAPDKGTCVTLSLNISN